MMISLRNDLTVLCTLVVVATTSYAQSFNNIVVDGSSSDQSETSIAIDPSNPAMLMATWNDYSDPSYSQPGYAFSTDSGRTWINQGILTSGLNPSNGDYNGGFDPSCAIDNSGREYYAFVSNYNYSSVGCSGVVDVEYSTDSCKTWNGPFEVSTNTTNEDKPYLTVDNSGDSTSGRVYVAWSDLPDIGSPTIYIAYPSTMANLGGTWVTKNISSTANFETAAVPVVGPDGTVYVA